MNQISKPNHKFNDDKETQEILSKTIKLETVNQADYNFYFILVDTVFMGFAEEKTQLL